MKPIDLNVDITDLLPDDSSHSQEQCRALIFKTIEMAILSFHCEDRIGAVSQRKIDRILDAVESGMKDKLVMSETLFFDFRKMWEGRKFKPAGGAERKMIQRIDRRICPEAYQADGAHQDEDSPEMAEG